MSFFKRLKDKLVGNPTEEIVEDQKLHEGNKEINVSNLEDSEAIIEETN